MWQEIIDFFIPVLIAILKATIKNPQSKRIEGTVIAELAQVATGADAAVNGNAWSFMPGTPIVQAAQGPWVFPVSK